MFSFLQKTNEDEAKVITQGNDQALVLAFQSSVQPVLWRANLSAHPELAFQVIEQDGGWVLGVNVPAKPFAPIAQFVTRDEADAAFALARTALVQGVRRPIKVGWFVFAAAVVFLGLYLIYIGSPSKPTRVAAASSVGQVVSGVDDKTGKPLSGDTFTRPAPGPAKVEDGVPFSADDVLKPPPED